MADCMRLIKGSTAKRCNEQLCRTGAFWHHESYDHYVRNNEEFVKIITYILNNPVKAGLAKDWRGWRFNYLAEKLLIDT